MRNFEKSTDEKETGNAQNEKSEVTKGVVNSPTREPQRKAIGEKPSSAGEKEAKRA
jgi:hypothetical protein